MQTLTKNQVNTRQVILTAAVIWFLLLSTTVLAQDFTKPINVQADNAVYDERAGTQTLSGNVEVSQGSMSISADRIEIEIKNGTLYRITGTGSPIRFQQMTLDNQLITGQCEELVYNTATSEITFIGNANFERPGQRLSGHSIEYNLSALTFKAAGSDSGRVNITLQPGQLNR